MTSPKKSTKKPTSSNRGTTKARQHANAERSVLSNKARVEEFLQHIRDGEPIETACALTEGFNERTFHGWMSAARAIERGETEHQYMPRTPAMKARIIHLLQQVTRAKSEAHAKMVKAWRKGAEGTEDKTETVKITKETRLDADGKPYEYVKEERTQTILHRDGDWRAAQAFLERRDPENWSLKHRLEHTGADGAPIEVTVKAIDEFADLFKSLREREANGGDSD